MSDAKKRFLDIFYNCTLPAKGSLIESLFWELNSEEKIENAIKRFEETIDKGKALPPWTPPKPPKYLP